MVTEHQSFEITRSVYFDGTTSQLWVAYSQLPTCGLCLYKTEVHVSEGGDALVWRRCVAYGDDGRSFGPAVVYGQPVRGIGWDAPAGSQRVDRGREFIEFGLVCRPTAAVLGGALMGRATLRITVIKTQSQSVFPGRSPSVVAPDGGWQTSGPVFSRGP